jgi:prepilin-type N-terminal cleavage/methylation domain-containing protein
VKRGFTLLEVVLGLALLALVIGLVQGVYSGVSRSRERVSEQTAGAHAAALFLHRLADELASARGLTLDRDAAGDAELEFSTVLPLLLQEGEEGQRGGEGFVTLGYSVEDVDDSRSLVRTDSRSAGEGGDPASDEVLRHVTRFRVQVSSDGEKWHDGWEAASTAADEGAPRVVTVEVAWRDGADGKGPERSLRTMAPLYGVVLP